MIKILAICAALVVCALLAVALTGARGADLKPGDMAPDFTLPASDGKTYALADLRGQAVVLAWFPRAFTGG